MSFIQSLIIGILILAVCFAIALQYILAVRYNRCVNQDITLCFKDWKCTTSSGTTNIALKMYNGIKPCIGTVDGVKEFDFTLATCAVCTADSTLKKIVQEGVQFADTNGKTLVVDDICGVSNS